MLAKIDSSVKHSDEKLRLDNSTFLQPCLVCLRAQYTYMARNLRNVLQFDHLQARKQCFLIGPSHCIRKKYFKVKH